MRSAERGRTGRVSASAMLKIRVSCVDALCGHLAYVARGVLSCSERGQPSVGRQVLALDVLTSSVRSARSAERHPPCVGRRCMNAESVPRSER